MKLILILFSTFCFSQNYTFDTKLIYEVDNLQEIQNGQRKEIRSYYINSNNPDIMMLTIDYKDSTTLFVLRDDHKDLIAKLILKQPINSAKRLLTLNKSYLSKNNYVNPMRKRSYRERDSLLDDNTILKTITYRRRNKYRHTSYEFVIDKNAPSMPLGVGFGDYYSLFPLDQKAPRGLILSSKIITSDTKEQSVFTLLEKQKIPLNISFTDISHSNN